ncbi:elongation of very long chain fatty acids protein 4-like isoform X2 [Dendronephthya gigantea]|uniref:elongation of very long chain fatty acids protein 4-like isoform X2 n=1 Tax=Dendronephthya gigantea TaxID=151771 RepID=UPI00106AB881|nr:elongation of very long chain fatty acids protein 4-like isoform X2 [Dendronephthya gigantea]
MEKIISNVEDFIIRVENASDPRVKDWPLVQSIWCPVLAVMCYIVVVILGPRIMKNQQAFQLRVTMILYNFLAIVSSGYMFIKLLVSTVQANYSFICQAVDYSIDKPIEIEIARIIWLHYLSKYFEMLDTVIFILRKKERQISFLHVYHHSSVLILWWIAAKWIPGGSLCSLHCENISGGKNI